MKTITTHEMLDELYGEPVDRALWKEIDHINDHYRQFIEASPFFIMSTYGEKGIDCSPRGDPPGFVRIVDEKTLLIPDRKGNNRIDSLRNIVDNALIGMVFFVPMAGEVIRVSGTAEILVDDELCASFAMNGKPASSLLRVHVNKAYFQCPKAIARSGLWDHSRYADISDLPTTGQMLKQFAKDQGTHFDGDDYDQGYAEYMKKSMY